MTARWPSPFPPLDAELDRFARQLGRRFGCDPVRIEDPVPGLVDAPGVVVWRADPSIAVLGLRGAIAAVGPILTGSLVAIVDLPTDALGSDPVATAVDHLESAGATVAFVGPAPAPPQRADRVVALCVGPWYRAPSPAPEDFGVVAVMTAYNEADIVRPSIERLIAQGIDVHLIDNWSTDGTPELVEDLVGHGLLAVERFPPGGRPDGYDWTGLLDRAAEVAATLPHDWCIHHDVDQRRDGPWPGWSLRDALWTVDRSGWTAVDHTIFEFRPTDDAFVDGTEVSEHHRHFELVPDARSAVHVQAWRNGTPVELSWAGGHEVRFDGRRVYPFNFTLRHYPIRSQRHGEQKVFRDRKPRYSAAELALGWHHHYDRLRRGHRFVRDPRTLHAYDPARFDEVYLLPRIGQICIPDRPPGAIPTAKAVVRRSLRAVGAEQLAVRVRSAVARRR